MRIINYQILSVTGNSGHKELAKAVNDARGNGWEPVGGASVGAVAGYGNVYIQAMVKYENGTVKGENP